MSLKEKEDRGDKTPRFEFRPGVSGFPEWKGIQREPGDPGSIASNAVWTAINVRFNGVSFLSRGGQSVWNSTPESGCIYGIFDFEGVDTGGTGGAVLVGGKNPIINVSDQPYAPTRYDEGAVPQFFKYNNGDFSNTVLQKCIADSVLTTTHFDDTNGNNIFANNCFFKLNGKLYGLGDGYNYSSGLFTGTPAVYEISYSPKTLTLRKVMDLSSRVTYAFSAINERDISAAGGVDVVNDVAYLLPIGGNSLIRWSQSTGLTTEVTGGPSYRTIGTFYREKIFLSSRDSLRRRDSAGSYTNIALPAMPSAKAHFFPWDNIVYGDKLYICGAAYNSIDPNNSLPVILVYDGASCTVSLAPTCGAFIQGGAWSMTIGYSNLYVAYTTDNSITACAVAKYDGSSWNQLEGTAITDGPGNALFLSEILFDGKDFVINGIQNDNSGTENTSAPCILRTTGSDFGAIISVADSNLNTDHAAFGDMILVDQD